MKLGLIILTYNFINKAKLSKMEDTDKFSLVKLIREFRKINENFEDLKKETIEAMKDDEFNTMLERQNTEEGKKYFANLDLRIQICLNKELDKEIEIKSDLLSETAFEKLVASNDWNVGEIIDLQSIICK